MSSSLKQFLDLIIYAVFIVFLSAGTVNAFIIESHTLNQDNTYTYSYTIDNSLGEFDIQSWSLDFPIIPDWNQNDFFSIPAGEVMLPNSGWTALPGTPVFGLSAQDFVSLNASFEVEAGQTLGGFSFTSSFAPGGIAFYEFGTDAQSNTGMIVGPIPEPETWQLFAIALGLLFIYKRKCEKPVANST